jgi:predicted PurR-regulated permease PerM
VWWLLAQSWGALGPFMIALVLAYFMLPLVDLLSTRLPRAVAILLVYLVFIGIVWALFAWLTPPITEQIRQFTSQLPAYSEQVQNWTKAVADWYNSLPISDDVRQSIESGVSNSLGAISSAIQQGVLGVLQAVSRAMGFIVGLLIIPFWLFYVLKDKDRGIAAFNNMLPRSSRPDVWRIVRIINGVLSSYIRGQLLLAVAVGVATVIGMLIVGAPYALLLGLISAVTEVIPVIGPVLGAIPGLAVAAFTGDWVLLLKVLVVYVLVQQLENNLLVPKIQGDSVKLHPAMIMVALVIGSQVAGLLGLIVAVPVAAILRDLYLYLYLRFAEGFRPQAAEARVTGSEGGKSGQKEP